MSKWHALVTRTTSATIEVDVEASSEDAAIDLINNKLRDGDYDQDFANEFVTSAPASELDQIYSIKEVRDDKTQEKSAVPDGVHCQHR